MPESLHHWLFERFLPQNLKCRSPKTVKQYQFAFNDFARFLGRDPQLGDLTDETIAAFVKWLNGPREICARTSNERAGRLKTAWNWLARKRIVDQFPTVGKLPEAHRTPAAWSENELVKLCNSCRRERGYIEDIERWRWWMTIHGWWWCAAERTEATLLVPVTAFRLDEGVAVVPAEIRKGRRQPRVYHLWPDLVEMLRMILPPHTKPRERMWPWPYHSSTFYNSYKRLLRRVGLPHDRYSAPHRMRVSRATWTKLSGGDATAALGHASDKTTRRHYIDPAFDKQDETKLFRPW